MSDRDLAQRGDAVKPKALLLHGGPPTHNPDLFAEFAEEFVLVDCEVTHARTLDVFDPFFLSQFDLLIPIWMFDEISSDQERALLNAVRDGLGLVSWHGATSAFLNSRPHKHMLGGQFVAHPGGAETTYRVRFEPDQPLTAGLEDVVVTSEQYYMLLDPAIRPLAYTTIEGTGMEWLAGVEMPVAWTREWGQGRVFYCSLGHTLADLESHSVRTLFRRAAAWAARTPARPEPLPVR